MRPVALLALAFAAAAASASAVVADDAPANSAVMSQGWEFGEQGGADLFRNVCAACHQADAKGAVGAGTYPPLAADKNLGSIDFVLVELFGGLRDMPPVGDMMSDAQVADVVNYVRTHFGNFYTDPVLAADVAAGRRRAPASPK
jgi:mono/diheme cytochrome c family protein